MLEAVYLRWIDSSAPRSSIWHDLADVENAADAVETVALIVSESDDAITIAHSFIGETTARTNASVGGVLTIPKAAITHREGVRFGNHRQRKAA